MIPPTSFQMFTLAALQRRNMYGGTVPAGVIACRRAKNRAARRSRRINRVRAA